MKKLVLTALLCSGVASMATGCIIVDDDEPNTITASWTLLEGDANLEAACPPGATTIAMVSQDPFGETWTDLFDCTTGYGTSGDMPAGSYVTWLQLTDDAGGFLYAQSLSTDVTVYEDGDTTLAYEFSLDRGSFYMDWMIDYAGAPSDCATVGAVNFSMLFTDANGDLFDEDLFDCDLGTGSSRGLPAPANWTVSPSILDVDNLAIAVGNPIESSLDYGNHYKSLGSVLFDVP